MINFLTGLAFVGEAVSSAAWLALVGRRQMIWPIPMGWHTNNVQLGTVPLKCINADIRTVYTMISAEGTIVVSKLSHWISRGTNCVVTLDGEVVNGDQ